jgi:type II secretion system protein H
LRCERGFTLIELLVVIALGGLMLAIVVPSLGLFVPRDALAAATVEIRAGLRGASSTAITEGRTVVFRGDPGNGGYWLDRQFHPLASARVDVAGARTISFFAWGGSSGGRVWIDSPAGRREIAVGAVSGRALPQP